MKTLSIDLETYSETDLPSCGAARYVEDPAFEILLFAYSADYGPVTVVDMANGEDIPSDILSALHDPSVEKTAYNAPFERTCLGKFYGYMEPEQWDDTMVLASECGLPLGLKAVGEALNLGEEKAKMKEGADLIRFFCIPRKPTKSNPAKRNLPWDYPDKWEVFKAYNKRDVEVENTIRQMLLKWRQDKSEHDLWALDQRINDKGMGVDLVLAQNAVTIGEEYRERLLARAQEISGLDNPNSTEQIKAWLREQEGVTVTSLNKKVVADVVASLSDEKCKEFMDLRSEFSKSSVKKYDAVIRSATKDSHIHGCFQFAGAGRTGRWCLTGDHEVLTPNGWVRLDEWGGGHIAVWNPTGRIISFQKANALAFDYDGMLEGIETVRCSQLSTPDHCMPFLSKSGNIVRATVHEKFGRRFSMPFTGTRTVNTSLNNLDVRILIMTQADGHYAENGDLKLRFKRPRKVERCRELLRKADIPYVETSYATDGVTQFSIRRLDQPLFLRQFRDKTFGWWMLDENPQVILDEIEQWDGTRSAKNSIQYTTTNKQNADIVQAVAYLAGGYATTLVKNREVPEWSDAYIVNIWLTPGKSTEVRAKDQYVVPFFTGKVYCAETQTGYFVVRRNGRIWVTGNSGRLVQLQNLARNSMEDLDSARTLVRAGDADGLELIYPNVQGVLSELVRTVLVPEKGQKFIVADFSAIEARVIAWIAGEEWRQKVFANGGDIYCMSASQMFHVPVVKHGVNGELRQKGKVAELACGFGGGVGALKAFGADKMGLSDEEMSQIVDKWREASPHICALWRSLEQAAVRCIRRQRSTLSTVGGIRFDYEDGVLFMVLPSGRRIAYWGASFGENRWGNPSLSYWGTDQKTKKWSKLETWGGKLVENLVQATARDCLKEAMLRLDSAGYDIRGHVHDEVIITAPLSAKVEDAAEIMGAKIPWAPGLLLRADGYECDYYRKD